ncbi:AAA family ATPase [Thiothrix fructosivorans]|uniref:AAA family ATPase n=1 Tax=Thiothrix fructosivorans TaxID=111770 RepID=A0ABS3IHU1_9GAMM|nr:AAA family ATPase [Thiothrix fructosivorans]MBO0612597.1 AAA family ATPase [Thiothrix fructosivorans]
MINNYSFIFLNRLVVLKNNTSVYDQFFYQGINIIRGDNGTGKSTIMDLIYYGLGAELSEWTAEPLSCDKVFLEVSCNTGIYTLSREIEQTGKSPMLICEGDYLSSTKTENQWLKYLNRRSDERHSYSQQLFDMMNLPQHKNNDSANLTIHQILRLMYLDQITAPTKILRYDTNYDNANIRQAIGEYLLGLDDLDIHELRQQLIELERDFSKIEGELKAIYKLLSKGQQDFTADKLHAEILAVESEIYQSLQKKEEIRFKTKKELDDMQKEQAKLILMEINKCTEKLENLHVQSSFLSNEIIDSTLFLQSIDYRIKSLLESKITNESLGSLNFKYCPACLTKIETIRQDDICGLCKSPKNEDSTKKSYLHMLNELNFQKRESEKILQSNKNLLDEIKTKIPELENLLSMSKLNYKDYLQSNSAMESQIAEISNRIGFLESKHQNLKERLEFFANIEALIKEKQQLVVKISEVKDALAAKKEKTKNRLLEVCSQLETTTMNIVKMDLGFEKDFENPEEFEFSFPRDTMWLNGKSKFSASSMVLLKNSFRLATLVESTKDINYRFPRFLLIDNIEDKGMMPSRSHNFQNIMVEMCEELENPYQLIYTTSMISPKLEGGNYCRGIFYKKGTHTLELNKI